KFSREELNYETIERNRKYKNMCLTNFKHVCALCISCVECLNDFTAYRAKLSMLNTMSRIRGQGRSVGYPQTEGMLGDCMLRYGQELGPASGFGGALTDTGEALQQVSQAKDALDIKVKHTFIDPLQDLHNRDLKEIKYQLKKLQGRRLDFDYKKRRRGKLPEEEVRQAWNKFTTSKELAERSMFTLLENEVSPLTALIAAVLDFHRHAYHILLGLHGNLQARELVLDQPCCRAIYSFRPENEGELGFKEGDLIILTNRIDGNWYEGTMGGQSGFFPISYVDTLVPLPLP
uniref:SH3-domain GRB2-like 3b n=1 Tax=Myripristis murdjan TaxID=586833 RepID=A0A667XSH9_9TELE